MIAESLAQYRIIKKLGKGGMGEVYLAQDTKLDRKVAIKILSAEALAHENAKKRLIREAQAAAKLDHPNICAIYDVNEVESLTFIVMQYVEGETLADRMKDKRLSLSTALDVARQAAEALAEAHAHGIVHRDIKPQNIMITPRGLVKILDFGLCKQLPTNENIDNEAPTMSLLSAPGLIIGTIPYMSPEQLSGEPVDEASDIFSLGITFYEMLAGKNPFKAQSAAVTMSQILTKEVFPEQLTDISPELQGLLKKMLNKEKGQRYRSATELLADLNQLPLSQLVGGDETQSLGTGTREVAVTPTKENSAVRVFERVARYKWAALVSLLVVILAAIGIRYFFSGEKLDSLAILPFTYASNDAQLMANPDHEYLSDGLTESIINNLSQLPDLRVIARSSVFSYKGKNLNAQAIGRELNVRAVLAGQISQNGDVLTIKAELIDVQTNRQLWYGAYPGKRIADIQAIQKEIARRVSERLRLNLTGADQTHLAKTQTESGEAYEAYLKGRYHWNKRTEEGFKQAIKFFREAIDKDPNYALAYTGLADCYTLESDYGFRSPSEGYGLAKDWATLALKYDNNLAEAHTSLASTKAVTDWDWQGAENEYLRAIELNPKYATAHHWYAAQLMIEGKLDQARLEIRNAQQLDPMSLGINKDFAVILLFARDYDEAMKQCRATLEIQSTFRVMSTYIAQIYELQGKYPEAIVELERAHAAALDDGEITYGLAQAYALGGKKDAAVKLANELNQPSKENIYLPKEAAYLTFLLGDKDNAVAIVQKAYENHYLSVAEIKMDPRFDGLRADPRVAKILQDIGLGQ